jgi:histone acetyltransferase (RNA polymerase elongator complex component)
MFEFVLNSPDLQVDQWKIYPCAVVPWTRIEKWYNNWKEGYDTELNPEKLSRADNRLYHPYANDELEDVKIKFGKVEIHSSPLIELLMCVKAHVHPWIRLNRIVRDIPGLYITGGNDRENLRQVRLII